MFIPPPLPRNLEAAFRDLASQKTDTRAGAARDVVRHALADSSLRDRAIEALVRALDDKAAIVRSAAVLGLGELDATGALPHLLLRVEDDDAQVRQMALTAIGELGDARALPRLRRAVVDERPEVRYQAVIATSRIAPVIEAAQVLTSALSDKDENVRYIALRVAEERWVDAKEDPERDEAFAPFTEAARTLAIASTPRLIAAAAIYLARIGDDAARAQLLRVVRGDLVVDKEDEQEAVELAGELELREAIPELERRAYGPARWVRDTCSFHARIALARLGDDRARREIERDLSAGRFQTRSAAVVAAGRAGLVALRSAIAALSDDQVDPVLRQEALALLAKERA